MDLWTSIAPDIQQVFKDLNLTQYFPGKITAQTARLRGRSDAKELSHIAWQFLENVLSLLYKGKGDFFQIAKTNVDTGMENLVSVIFFKLLHMFGYGVRKLRRLEMEITRKSSIFEAEIVVFSRI